MLPLRLNRRFFILLAVLMLCMSFLTITASAEANPPKDDVISWKKIWINCVYSTR